MILAQRRSLTAAGTALVGAGLIATSAIAPVQVSAPRLSDVAVQLQASVLDIFKFPAIQQSIVNEVEFATLLAAGLAEGGAGLAQSVAALPETLITTVQQILSGDVLGALTTVEEAAIGTAEATLIPVIASRIDVGQIQLAIQSALLPAQPIAFIELGAGLFDAFDTVTRAVITAGQNIVDAVLSLNIANIVQAVADGVTGVIASIGAGGQAAVDGIVAAQNTIADALAARPVTILPVQDPAPQSAAAAVPAVESPRVVEAPAPAAVETPAAADPGDGAAEAAAAGAPASDPAPRRAAARAGSRDAAATAGGDSGSPAKATGKRAARAAASS